MEQSYRLVCDFLPEITSLDARIARAGGTTSRIEMQPHRLRETKTQPKNTYDQTADLIRENGHLRQEIIYYQESRNAMLAFHAQALEAYHGLRSALRDLSEKLATAEGHIEQYWGIPLNETKEKDMTRV